MVLWTADTHVHYYPHYDAVRFFDAARKNLCGERKVLFLTERASEDFFNTLPTMSVYGYTMVVRENILEVIHNSTQEKVYLVKGFQIITEKKIEILSLASEVRCPDGLQEDETIQLIISSGGFPVLPWSPGKWSGERKRQILNLITQKKIKTGEILNSSLHLNSKFQSPLYGSDPLPLKNEESNVGKLGVSFKWFEEVTLATARSFLDQNLQKNGEFLPPHVAFLRTLRMNLMGLFSH